MAEYIEREALLKVLRGSAVGKYPMSFYMGLFAAANEVEKTPAADVVPVVHGRWIEHEIPDEPLYGTDYECSVCGKFQYNNWNYCPVCGADMRERKDGDG